MTEQPPRAEFKTYYQRLVKKSQQHALYYAAAAVLFCALIGYYGQPIPAAILGGVSLLLIYALHRRYNKKYYQRLQLLTAEIPAEWPEILEENATFYANLSAESKDTFNRRTQFFLAEKK